jgi:hypothetical protein
MKKSCDSTMIKMPNAMRALQMDAAAPSAHAAGSPIFMSAQPRCYLPATHKLKAANTSLVACLGGDSVQNASRIMRLARGYVAELVPCPIRVWNGIFACEEVAKVEVKLGAPCDDPGNLALVVCNSPTRTL